MWVRVTEGVRDGVTVAGLGIPFEGYRSKNSCNGVVPASLGLAAGAGPTASPKGERRLAAASIKKQGHGWGGGAEVRGGVLIGGGVAIRVAVPRFRVVDGGAINGGVGIGGAVVVSVLGSGGGSQSVVQWCGGKVLFGGGFFFGLAVRCLRQCRHGMGAGSQLGEGSQLGVENTMN